jgi:hypothetical protein
MSEQLPDVPSVIMPLEEFGGVVPVTEAELVLAVGDDRWNLEDTALRLYPRDEDVSGQLFAVVECKGSGLAEFRLFQAERVDEGWAIQPCENIGLWRFGSATGVLTTGCAGPIRVNIETPYCYSTALREAAYQAETTRQYLRHLFACLCRDVGLRELTVETVSKAPNDVLMEVAGVVDLLLQARAETVAIKELVGEEMIGTLSSLRTSLAG